MKKTIVFDLETIADPSVIPILPEIEPDSRLKDPEKIQDNIKEKTEKRNAELGMDPACNLICCFGWYSYTNKKADHIMLADEKSEKKLLQQAWDILSEFDQFVTFNGNSFDVWVLMVHSLRNRIRPAVQIDTKKYTIGNHFDLRAILGNWNPYAKGTLDFYSRLLLNKTSKGEMTGDQVQHYYDMDLKEDIGKYCEGDCLITAELFDLVQKYYLF